MEEERVPKYFALKKELIQKIEEEEFGPECPIPSERELMEQYQVSRITVRRAIDELVTGGYLYKVQGKGTYVKSDDYSQNLFAITSCTDDVIRLGRNPSKKVTVSEIVPADAKRARLLNTAVGDELFRLERITMADGEPLNYTITPTSRGSCFRGSRSMITAPSHCTIFSESITESNLRSREERSRRF